jgi:hypothetical protein
MKPLSLLLAILYFSTICKAQDSLIGNWKLISLSYKNHFTKTNTLFFNINKPDSFKNLILKNYNLKKISKNKLQKVKQQIDLDFKIYSQSYIQIESNNEFYSVSNGLIVPPAIPGYNFGKNVSGKWSYSNSALTLTVGELENSVTFFYKIKNLSNDTLILNETDSDYKEITSEKIFRKQ